MNMSSSRNASVLFSFERPIAMALAIAGVLLVLVSWWQSYPLYLQSPYSEIFSSISPLYWIGLILVIPSLLVLTLKAKRVQAAVASVLIFLTLKASAYFFYPLSYGSDPFFQSLLGYYFSGGHISVFQQIYPWPAFFVLGKLFELVTGLPTAILAHTFVFVMGVLMVAGVLLVVERRSVNVGAAVFGFTLLSYYFLNYQFAAQVLAFALFLLLIAVDFRVRLSRSRSLLQLLLFASVCFTHAFIPVFYLLYSFSQMIWVRKSHIVPSMTSTLCFLAIYISVLSFYTGSLGNISSSLYASLFELSGYTEYQRIYAVSAPPVGNILVQSLSRATVIGTGAVSAVVLVDMIRKKQFGSRDYALAATGTLYLLAGSALAILGSRAYQLLAVTASLPLGFFAAMKHKLPSIMIIALAIASVSLPMHSASNEYLFQDQLTAQQATFVASHFGTPGATVFMEKMTAAILLYSQKHAGTSIYIATELGDPGARLPSYDWYAITPGLIHNIHDGLSDASIPLNGINGYNRVIDDGREWWILYSGYAQA
jgi:hypothetical protein